MNTSVQQRKISPLARKKLLSYTSTKGMKQCLEPEPISTSHFITQAEIKIPAGGQEERRRIDIPILPCLRHLPPTLSHIIAADTGETNDSHVKNMGRRGEWQRWCAVGALMGHEIYCTSLTSAPTAAKALHSWQPVKSKRKPESAKIIGEEIASEVPLQY